MVEIAIILILWTITTGWLSIFLWELSRTRILTFLARRRARADTEL
jgi:hypothetical protein